MRAGLPSMLLPLSPLLSEGYTSNGGSCEEKGSRRVPPTSLSRPHSAACAVVPPAPYSGPGAPEGPASSEARGGHRCVRVSVAEEGGAAAPGDRGEAGQDASRRCGHFCRFCVGEELLKNPAAEVAPGGCRLNSVSLPPPGMFARAPRRRRRRRRVAALHSVWFRHSRCRRLLAAGRRPCHLNVELRFF